jgi:class 3 adenylate cyclase
MRLGDSGPARLASLAWRGLRAGLGRPMLRAGLAAGAGGWLVAGCIAHTTPITDRLDEMAFDAQVRMARWWRGPRANLAPTQDVTIVGIDDESLDALGVPLALIHESLGRALEAVALGRPRVVGLDLSLPQRSFDPLVPGLDRELLRGLLAARASAPVVLALDADGQGRLRVPALVMLAAAGGQQAFGLPFFALDCDGVVRRYDPNPGWIAARASCAPFVLPWSAEAAAQTQAGAAVTATPALPTFVARMAEALGRGAPLQEPGWIDYTRGAPFSYLPLRDVVLWGRQRDVGQLRAQFEGRVVLIGSVLPYLDRLRLPIALARWDTQSAAVPGLIVNAQVLRNVLGAGLVRPPGSVPQHLLVLALAALALVGRTGWRWALWLLSLLGILVGGAALQAAGWFCAPGQALLAGAAAAALRNAVDLKRERSERRRVTERMGGYLSPPVLDTVLQGRAGHAGTRRAVALLFADLRDFTTWSEATDPAAVLETLNRYYSAVTPVLHAHGGTIDNFRGDGIMVMFGAPTPSDHPCADALDAACQMSAAVDRFNQEQAGRGLAPIAVAIGMAYGEVVFGDLGSADRKDYTALGDAVNVAARLQDLAKRLDRRVLMTRDFAHQLPPQRGGILDLGLQEIKGHSPVAVCAVQTPERPAPARPGRGAA